MIVKITKEDVKAAQLSVVDQNVSECCPLFQALQRKGVPVARVGFSYICWSGVFINLPKSVRKLTGSQRESWPSFIGKSYRIKI